MLADRVRNTWLGWGATALMSLLALWMLISWSWVSDDALITGRVVANTISGEGPVFNITERVQAFTHPLWFTTWVVIAWVGGDVLLTPVVLGVVFSALTVFVLVRTSTELWAGILASALLVAAPGFATWGTSGLENSLAGLLLGAAFVVTRRVESSLAWAPLAAALLGLALVTRLDLVLLVGPPALVLLIGETWRRRALLVGLGSLPALVYLVASRAYYGYWLPATFYAKTNVDISRRDLIDQGLHYLETWIRFDPIQALTLVVGAIWLAMGPTARRLGWLVGLALYLFYVVSIGGDFMHGRFFYVPVVVAAFAVAEPPDAVRSASRVAWIHRCAAFGLLLIFATFSTLFVGPFDDQRWNFEAQHGIADERGYYVQRGYSVSGYVIGLPEGDRIGDLRSALAAWPSEVNSSSDSPIVLCGTLGTIGVMEGPTVHMIDQCGLADMYMAQLAFEPSGQWRIGHFARAVPEGYVESVATDTNLVVDPVDRALLNDVWSRTKPRAS